MGMNLKDGILQVSNLKTVGRRQERTGRGVVNFWCGLEEEVSVELEV